MNDNKETTESVELSLDSIETLTFYIESQCTIDEVTSIYDLTIEELERKFKLNSFEDFYKSKLLSGQAKLKAAQYRKALSGNTEMLKFLGRNQKPVEDASLTVVELPDNDRIKK